MRTSTLDDVAAATTEAAEAFRRTRWRSDGALRARVLHRFADALRAQTDRLAELLSREQGKTIGEARSEVAGTADMVEYYAGLARDLEGRALRLGPEAHGVVVREPLGVVAVITPWNWPLTLLVRSLAPALAAGNTAVVKPASLTPAVTVEALGLLVADAELPAGALGVVLGPGPTVGDALVRDREVAMVAFTGESGTGSAVMHAAADRLVKVALELGGKSPNIVFADAPFDKALDGALNAIYTTAGQICTAGSRLLLEASIYDRFLDAIARRTSALVVGDPLEEATEIGPLVSPAQRARVERYVELGRKEGTLVASAPLPDAELFPEGCFVAPCVLADLPEGSAVLSEEIFGPVLAVERFQDEDEALERAQRTSFGLAAGVWTSDVSRAWRVARALEAGTVWVNTYHHFYPEAEVGGFRRSGIGRQQGRAGLEEFTETKHLNFDTAAALW